MKGMTTIPTVAPVVTPENSRRQSIIDDYKGLWVQIYNESLPANIEQSLNEADLNTLVRMYERERVQHMQDGLY